MLEGLFKCSDMLPKSQGGDVQTANRSTGLHTMKTTVSAIRNQHRQSSLLRRHPSRAASAEVNFVYVSGNVP